MYWIGFDDGHATIRVGTKAMHKTPREVIVGEIQAYYDETDELAGRICDDIVAELDAAGFVIVPKDQTADAALERAYRDLGSHAEGHRSRGNQEKAQVFRFAAALILHGHSDPESAARKAMIAAFSLTGTKAMSRLVVVQFFKLYHYQPSAPLDPPQGIGVTGFSSSAMRLRLGRTPQPSLCDS